MGQTTARSRAKWDGNKLVITTKTEQGEQTQTWSLAGRQAHHRAHRRPRAVHDHLQEDHVRRIASFGSCSSRKAGSHTLPAFFLSGSDRAAGPRSSSRHGQPVTGSPRSGATSASGPSTKNRSRNRGCGTSVRPRPPRRRRRARGRDRASAGRRERAARGPQSPSIRSSASSRSRAGRSVSPVTTALRYIGWSSRPGPSGSVSTNVEMPGGR